MNLNTGAQLHARSWTSMPMTDDIIRTVNDLGRAQGQPRIRNGNLRFEWGNNRPILDEEQHYIRIIDDAPSDDCWNMTCKFVRLSMSVVHTTDSVVIY